MSNPIFGLDDWQPIFPVDDNLGVDLNGSFKMRMGDGLAMDLDSGEIMFTTSWHDGCNGFSDINSPDHYDDELDDLDSFDDDDF